MTAAEKKVSEGDLDVIDMILDPGLVGHSTLSPKPVRGPGECTEKDQKQKNLVRALHANHAESQGGGNMIRFILILAVVLLFAALVAPVALAAANTTVPSSALARAAALSPSQMCRDRLGSSCRYGGALLLPGLLRRSGVWYVTIQESMRAGSPPLADALMSYGDPPKRLLTVMRQCNAMARLGGTKMVTPDVYTSLKDYELNELPAVLAKAEQHRLLCEAGLIRRPWLLRQVSRSLWQLGHLITKVGQRLERRYAPLSWATGEVK